jgi:peptide/nickel transport system substrate-binding protein
MHPRFDDPEPRRRRSAATRRSPRWQPLALATAAALLAAACSADDSGGAATTAGTPASTSAPATSASPASTETTPTTATTGSSPATTEAAAEEPAPEPVAGGEITIGEFSPPRGFDPIMGAASNGSVGGIEMMALYDTIVSWDPDTGAYVPRTAASLDPNDDHSVWTLVLNEGITFTDGTPYDADAVKFNIERHLLPQSRSQAKVALAELLDSIDVLDPLTVQFTLSRPWTGFPFILSIDAGMIASPTAIQAAGDGFAANPGDAGAGPFQLAAFRPGESIVFERNEQYFGGPVPLDRVTFVPTPGGQEAAYAALAAGELDAAYFRSPVAIADATDEGLTVHRSRIAAGNVIDINAGVYVTCQGGLPAGCEGVADGETVKTSPPGADERVRRAIAAAIDPEQVNERTYQGLARAGTALFTDDFPLSPGLPGPTYDPELAAQLVAEARADGWDGSIRLYSVSDEVGQALGLTVSAMLTAAGMDVQLNSTFEPLPLTLEVIINHNFDLVIWGSGFTENPHGNYVTLMGGYSTGAEPTGYRGYSNPDMDAAIAALEVADSDTAVTEAYSTLAEVWNDDVPALALNELENALITQPGLVGIEPTSNSSFLLSGAWLAD